MKVDVHNHGISEAAIELLASDPVYDATVTDGVWQGSGHPSFEVVDSFVSAEAKMAELHAKELDGAVVSTAPQFFCYEVDAEPGEAMARAVNAGLAELAAARPDELRWLASVPLQAPERAAAVLEDAVADGCVGAELATSRGPAGHLDDDEMRPFWEAVERLGVPITLHPAYTEPHRGLGDFYLVNVLGFLFDTTVAIERLICSGTLDRHPGLRLVLLHAGGYFPWQAGRLRHAHTVRPELAESPADPFAYFGQVMVDPITHDPDALRYLVAKVGAENVVMGTDLPFDMAPPDPVGALRAACDDETAATIAERNPARLYQLTMQEESTRV